MSTNILQQKCFLNNQHYYPLNYLTIFLTSTNTDVSRLKIMDKLKRQTWRLRSSILPSVGHLQLGLLSDIVSGGSGGIFVYCNILSTDIILFSKLQRTAIAHPWSILRLSP